MRVPLIAFLTMAAWGCSQDGSLGSESSTRSRRESGGFRASSIGPVSEGSSQVKGGITPVNFQLAGVYRPGEAERGLVLDEGRGLVADCVDAAKGEGLSARAVCPSACDVGSVNKVEWTGFWRTDLGFPRKIACECIMSTKNRDLGDALKKAEADREIASIVAEAKAILAETPAVSAVPSDSGDRDGLYIGRYRGMRNAIFIRRSAPARSTGSGDSDP